jgi:hypothetical protein
MRTGGQHVVGGIDSAKPILMIAEGYTAAACPTDDCVYAGVDRLLVLG